MRSQKSVSENNHWKNVTPHPVPLYGGVPRSGGVVRVVKKLLPHCPTPSLLSLRVQRGNPFNKKSPRRAIFYFIIFLSHRTAIAGTKNKITPANPHIANVPTA